MRSSKLLPRAVLAAALGLGLAGCSTTRSLAFPVGTERHAARPAGTPVAIFRTGKPDRPYRVVARLNVHLEKTFLVPSAFDDALPELENLARQQGADAVIEIEEKKSRQNETFMYNVTGTAVAFETP
jgi:hypothetical protein